MPQIIYVDYFTAIVECRSVLIARIECRSVLIARIECRNV
jgi:hypothetical protein